VLAYSTITYQKTNKEKKESKRGADEPKNKKCINKICQVVKHPNCKQLGH